MVLSKLREPDEIELELRHIHEAILYEQSSGKSTLRQMWSDKSIRKRLLLAVWMNFGQQITGQGSLSSHSGKKFQLRRRTFLKSVHFLRESRKHPHNRDLPHHSNLRTNQVLSMKLITSFTLNNESINSCHPSNKGPDFILRY
jgi:hypothetical protein